jgi:hypothetical protein
MEIGLGECLPSFCNCVRVETRATGRQGSEDTEVQGTQREAESIGPQLESPWRSQRRLVLFFWCEAAEVLKFKCPELQLAPGLGVEVQRIAQGRRRSCTVRSTS